MEQNVFEIEEHLIVDEKILSRLARQEIGEANIKVLGETTRIRLYMHNPVLVNEVMPSELLGGNKNLFYYSIGLRCTLHPHFEHTIKYARLSLDFSGNTPGLIIKDLFPKKVTEPVSYRRELKLTTGLEFNFFKLSGEVSESSEVEYYFPTIKAYGLDSRVAYFDFISGNNEIKIDNMLYMLVQTDNNKNLKVNINIIVTVKGKGNLEIPLISRKNSVLSKSIYLLENSSSEPEIEKNKDVMVSQLNILEHTDGIDDITESPLLFFKGINGQVYLFRNKLLLTRKGAMARYTQNKNIWQLPPKELPNDERFIYYHHLKRIDFKKVNILTNGYIRFVTEKSKNIKSILEMPRDEDTIMFGLLKQGMAVEIKRFIEQAIKNK